LQKLDGNPPHGMMPIGTSSFVNQRCALRLDPESALLAQALKNRFAPRPAHYGDGTPSRALEIGVIL
jgi:hypothetical protein